MGAPNHTEDYQYGDANWKDKLTARVINGVSYPVVSDAIGNITSYAGWTYAWQAGRQLASQTNSGGTVEYKYNADGLRVQKKRGSTVTDYVLSGKNIAHMTVTGGHTLHFYYDAQDRPAQVQYNGTMYRYVHNLQGDILAILDSAGNTVVQYAYDAWGGKKTTTGSMAGTLGYYNPFRYRGYVWDEETWMYYLRSRYYYPELQRFISADNLLGAKGRLFSHNTYAYGSNTPVISKDMDGNESEVAYPPLAGNEFGKMTLGPISKMTNLEFIAHLRQMADEKWKYEYGYVQFKAVDCVGAYRYIMKWYYKEKSYGRLFNIMDSKTKKMRSLTTVSQLVSKGTYGVKLIENYDDLSIGMAVFRKGVSKWEHVGYYIGKTEQYGHTIIEARDEQSGVIYSSLIGSSFTHYGELTGIEYR